MHDHEHREGRDGGAGDLLQRKRTADVLHASEVTRLEVLAGMRPAEEDDTRALLSTLIWHPVDTEIAEEVGALGRQWLPSHHTIDSADLAIADLAIADLAIAATAIHRGS